MKNTLITIGAVTLAASGVAVDASKYDGKHVEPATLAVAAEQVSIKQVDAVVEATLPLRGEKGITVKYDLKPSIAERIADKVTREVVTEKVSWRGEDGFKLDVILYEKPLSNTFCYTLEGDEDYRFVFQPPLTKAEIANGAERPDEVVGSYAVFDDTLNSNQIGNVKVMHILYPYVWEIGKESEKVRAADFTYKKGELCVTAPKDFMDNADYTNGVRIDPTYGYTSVGATNLGVATDRSVYTEITNSGADCTAANITIYADLAGHTWKGMVLTTSGGDPSTILTNGISDVGTAVLSTWTTAAFPTPPSLTASTVYHIGAVANETGTGRYRYDAGGNSDQDASNSYATPQNPGATTELDGRISMYITCTEAAGGSSNFISDGFQDWE